MRQQMDGSKCKTNEMAQLLPLCNMSALVIKHWCTFRYLVCGWHTIVFLIRKKNLVLWEILASHANLWKTWSLWESTPFIQYAVRRLNNWQSENACLWKFPDVSAGIVRPGCSFVHRLQSRWESLRLLVYVLKNVQTTASFPKLCR